MADRTDLLLWRFSLGVKERKYSTGVWESPEKRQKQTDWTGSGLSERGRGIAEAGQGWGDFTIIRRTNWYLGGHLELPVWTLKCVPNICE